MELSPKVYVTTMSVSDFSARVGWMRMGIRFASTQW